MPREKDQERGTIMWEYKVVAGSYTVDGANVFVKNTAGEGTLQQILDHYGSDRWELVSSSLDNLNREVVIVFKRPKGGVAAMAAPSAAGAPAPAAPAGSRFVDADGEVVKRRTPGAAPGSAPGGRRPKRDLDALAD
ncbi:DUF4177 domain-containing protein [bacterium]|nr:DUF4177 domain-containing protein [bacterium]